MATLKPKGRNKNLFIGPNAVMPSAQGLASGLTCRKGRHSLKRCEVTELTISLFFVLPSASSSSRRYASEPPLSEVLATGCRRFIGKESARLWEWGEDMSLWEFKAIEYECRGYAMAADEQLRRIAKVAKREFVRRGINQHGLEKNPQSGTRAGGQVGEMFEGLEEYEVSK
jgi:hypothetical protein